jgi:hypothetical protein
VTTKELTILLAEKVMGWRVAPDRFLMDGRRWLATWRFQPTKNIADAFQLLERADVNEYILRVDRKGLCRAKVRTSSASGEATSSSLPLAICVAVARAYGIRVEGRG